MIKKLSCHANQASTFLLGGNLPIYRMGFGALQLTGPHGFGNPQNRKNAHAVLKKAVSLGVNFIDTADSYGPEVSENIIAEALYPYPKDLVIATKGGLLRPTPEEWEPMGRPEYLMQCVEMSLRRLKLECIDLYQLHAVDPKVPIEESLGALKEMQHQGKIRHIGLSNVSVKETLRAKKVVDVVSVQNQYNLSNRSSEDVLKYCESNQLAFIPWFPIANGHLAEKKEAFKKVTQLQPYTPAQMALAWLLKHSASILLIPGTSSLEHLEENISAASIELADEQMKQIEHIFS